jgi:hypothetical protein
MSSAAPSSGGSVDGIQFRKSSRFFFRWRKKSEKDTPSWFTAKLASNLLPRMAGHILQPTRVLGLSPRDNYSRAISANYTFQDGIGTGLFFIYQEGTGCSSTLGSLQ